MRPGPSVSLKCSAAGNPTPQISWLLDGFDLPQNDRLLIGQYVTVYGDVISHVNITTVKAEDGGEYECIASSRAGKSRHSARLNIYGESARDSGQRSNAFREIRKAAGPCTCTPRAGKLECAVHFRTWKVKRHRRTLTRRNFESPNLNLPILSFTTTLRAKITKGHYVMHRHSFVIPIETRTPLLLQSISRRFYVSLPACDDLHYFV